MTITIEKLEALEKSGCLTHELRQELSRLRREKELEIQLAAAEKKAEEKAASELKTKIIATRDPRSQDDIAILSLWSHPHHRLVNEADREVLLSDSSVSFLSRDLYAELKPKLMRFIAAERFPVLAVVEDWQSSIHSPETLIAARVRPSIPAGTPTWHRQPDEPSAQHAVHLTDNCRSIPLLILWAGTSHKAKIMLARNGIPHPPELEGTGFDAIQHWRALEQKKADAFATEKARLEKHQRGMLAMAQEREELRARTREAARAAYHVALEQADNVTPEPPKRARKTASQHAEASE